MSGRVWGSCARKVGRTAGENAEFEVEARDRKGLYQCLSTDQAAFIRSGVASWTAMAWFRPEAERLQLNLNRTLAHPEGDVPRHESHCPRKSVASWVKMLEPNRL